jgi:hypothetical protein
MKPTRGLNCPATRSFRRLPDVLAKGQAHGCDNEVIDLTHLLADFLPLASGKQAIIVRLE